jgi:uncharacterized protein (TIGR03435 family)
VRHRTSLRWLGPMLLAWPLAAHPQDAPPRLLGTDGKPIAFAIVSVKPNHSGAPAMSIMSPPNAGSMTIVNMPLETIVQWAFGIFLHDQIAGMPGWAAQERFDIAAKVDDADLAAFRKITDPVQRTPMLQPILAERFNLKSHYEMRVLPVYELVVAKSGPRITEIQPALGPNGMKDGGARQMGRGQIKSMGQPMKPLVYALTTELGLVVIDKTGLTGYYNFTLRWTPDETTSAPGDSAQDSSAPSIFTALHEQLGLKLLPAKAPVQVLVIDHLERPSPN